MIFCRWGAGWGDKVTRWGGVSWGKGTDFRLDIQDVGVFRGLRAGGRVHGLKGFTQIGEYG